MSRNVFELDGDRVGAARERLERRHVIGCPEHRPVGYLRGGVIVAGCKDAGDVAHALGGLDEHPAKLTAAHHAERSRRIEHRFGGCACGSRREAHAGASPTASVLRLTKAGESLANFGVLPAQNRGRQERGIGRT